MNNYVGYLRTSTKKQLLGIAAQKDKIKDFISQREGSVLLDTFVEQESGLNNNRKQLQAAIQYAKENNARLLIATMDRLTRKASFFLQLQEDHVKFTICDMPEADETTISILAVIAQREVKMIQQRTRNGLRQIKKKLKKDGQHRTKASNRIITKLGNTTNLAQAAALAVEAKKKAAAEFAREILPKIKDIRENGKVNTYRGIAAALNARGIKSKTEGKWYASSVRNVEMYR
jgi:DNA invertase Pin-like site-specific DNA recombinase